MPAKCVPAGATSASLVLTALLADGRWPGGSHAHSGGLEAAGASGAVHDLDTLGTFLAGRLVTVGLAEAALAAAAALAGAGATDNSVRRPDAPGPPWEILASLLRLDEEAAARCPSPAMRRASRSVGRAMLRSALRAWPDSLIAPLRGRLPAGPMAPVALGVTVAGAGLSADAASLLAAQSSVAVPAWAAVRLLALDPLDVAALLVGLAPAVAHQADTGCAVARSCWQDEQSWVGLPAPATPLLDIDAEGHRRWEVRLFAS